MFSSVCLHHYGYSTPSLQSGLTPYHYQVQGDCQYEQSYHTSYLVTHIYLISLPASLLYILLLFIVEIKLYLCFSLFLSFLLDILLCHDSIQLCFELLVGSAVESDLLGKLFPLAHQLLVHPLLHHHLHHLQLVHLSSQLKTLGLQLGDGPGEAKIRI